jgi:hypothetical protein
MNVMVLVGQIRRGGLVTGRQCSITTLDYPCQKPMIERTSVCDCLAEGVMGTIESHRSEKFYRTTM